MIGTEVGPIAHAHGIRLLLQFGSSVTGTLHAASDIDVAVLLERPDPGFDEYASLVQDLQALFPDREIDLSILNHADPLLLKKVTESYRLLYGAERDLQRLRLHAFRRYQDHRKYLELERRFVAHTLGRSSRDG
jgi:predicted nucleotidyltransferase